MKPDRPKIFSIDAHDLWVEARLPAEEGLGEADTVSFPVSSISYVRSLGPTASVIALQSGLELTLNLARDELMQRLAESSDTALDLKPYAALENKPALMRRLKEEFRDHTRREKYAPIEGLVFTAHVRAAQHADFKPFKFSGRDVDAEHITNNDSILGGRNMEFTLRAPLRGPFGTGSFIIEGDYDEFIGLCRKARDRGDDTLDLTEFSLRKAKAKAGGPKPPESGGP